MRLSDARSCHSGELGSIVEASHAQVLTLLRGNRARLEARAAALLENEALNEADAYAASERAPAGAATGTYAATARSAAA